MHVLTLVTLVTRELVLPFESARILENGSMKKKMRAVDVRAGS